MQILGYDFSLKKTNVSAKTESSTSQGRRNPAVIKIVENFKDSSRKDIQKWRNAIKAAQNIDEPKFNMYYDLIDDLMTDGHLQSQIQMRKLSTLNTDHQVINRKTGDVNEDLTFILQQQWFHKFLDQGCLDHIILGTTVPEFQSFNNEKIEMSIIPRRNVVPTKGRIYPDITKNEFINYLDENFKPWLFQIGEPYNLGIINNIIPNLIWKRNVMQAWAEFCERFGLPLITATSNTTDSKILNDVHDMLLQLGEASVGTFPAGTDIKFQEANRTDAYNVYMQFMQSNSNEISKMLVGSTMLSDQGTNRSQTEVHERSLDYKLSQADKRQIQFIVNDQLFPLLRLQGYNISEDDFWEFKTAEQETDLPQLWNITNGLLTAGYEVEQEWISKTFNIPIEGKKKIQPTVNVAASYFPEKPQRYEFTCTCGNHTQAIGKFGKDLIVKFCKELIGQVYNGSDTLGTVGKLIAAEAMELVSGLRSNFKTFNPYTGPDLLALQMMEYNVFEFSASKTEARLVAMKDLLIDYETKQIRDFASFRVECDKVMKDYNSNWLEAEYNLSIAVGQTSAQYVRFMAEKDTVTSFVQYQTVGDDKVRGSHEILDGKIFSLDDKEAMKLWPPNGYGCRCEMLQYVGGSKDNLITGIRGQELIQSRDPKYKDSQFHINRGDLKQVFTDKQFYSDNKGLTKKINEMTYDKYGLKKWSDIKDDYKPIKLDKSITGDNVKELFKAEKGKDYMGFSDYLGRKMILPKKTFDNHTTGHYLNDEERRHQIFPHVKDILNNPDEVWLNERNQGKFNSHYVKFYNDRAVIVNVHLNNQMEGLEIQTWYNLKRDDAKERLGIKIK
ncbi:phage portal protein family protein [Epilithonimonas hominis]|uniref:phage portal protein family protein n=1 Tax=Epilithonimonas hominis TaxID=420404 RepID=UPI0028980D4D|nr:DUF935 family protein [Epilithonimonas hominis]